MGSSKSKPKMAQTDPERLQAAREAAKGVREKAQALGEVEAIFPPLEGEDEEKYRERRARAFYFNDQGYPVAVLVPKSAQQVAACVKMVAELDRDQYKLAVCCGGHTAASVVDGSIMIDLERINNVQVDAKAQTMRIGGGCKISAGIDALKGTGLGFVTGTNTDTGVSGLTLAGGIGYLASRHGWASDTVVEIEIVTADGEVRRITDESEPDLMRAIRGGGGNFGIVTEWTFKLFDVTHTYAGEVVHFAPTQYRAMVVLRNFLDTTVPPGGTTVAALPCGAPVVANVLSFIGSPDEDPEGHAWLAERQSLGGWFRLKNSVRKMDFCTELAPMLEPMQQPVYAAVSGVMVYKATEAVVEALVHFARVDTVPGAFMLVFKVGAEMAKETGRSTLRHRGADIWVICETPFSETSTPAEIQACADWRQRLRDRLMQVSDADDGPHELGDVGARERKAFASQEQRDFLLSAKQRYDAANLFSLNYNITQ